MSPSRLILILVVDAVLMTALVRAVPRPLVSPRAALLAAVVMLPGAFLLVAGLTSLAGKGGSDHLLLVAPPDPVGAAGVTSDCRVSRALATRPRRCRAPADLPDQLSLAGGAVRSPGGGLLRLAPARFRSNVELSRAVGEDLHIAGWAAATGARRAVEAIVVFSGPRSIGAVRPTRLRADVAEDHGRFARRSGFSLVVSRRDLRPEGGPAALRLVAVEGHTAATLTFDCRTTPSLVGC